MNKDEYLKALYIAYKEVKPLSKSTIPINLNLQEAYEIQHRFTALKEKDGEVLAGYKISATSEKSQALFNISEPAYGQITNTRIIKELKLSNASQPIVELELVFIAQEDLKPNSTNEELLKSVKVAPGIEVPDSRYEDWFPKITKEQLVSDGAAGGYITYGEAIQPTYESLDKIKGTLYLNDEEVSSNTSDIVLGHPLNSLKWLINKLDTHDLVIKKGMFVSSGTVTAPAPLQKGTYTGKFENFRNISLKVE